MHPTPTGKLIAQAAGVDLILERRLRVPATELWASLTESDRTARWFASWTGEAAAGATIRYSLTFEDGEHTGDMRIDACEPPRHLAVSTVDEFGSWRLEARVRADGECAVLTFTHHLADADSVGSVGPGWEYYLDNLAVSVDGGARPDFTDYYPAQQRYYEDTAASLR